MIKLSSQSVNLYKATTLMERISSLHAIPNKCNHINNTELSDELIQQYKSQISSKNASYFEQHLVSDNITEYQLLQILTEPIEAVQTRFSAPPDWLIKTVEAFDNIGNKTIPIPKELQDTEVVAFLEAIEPLITQGRDDLHRKIRKIISTYSYLPFDADTVEDLLFANLPEQLLWMLVRTLVLELNVARLKGVLVGHTPKERFQSYIQLLRQHDTRISLLEEYPVLARQIVITIDDWVSFSLEFIQHLCTDWEAIIQTFSPDNSPGLLIEINGGYGDTHRSGRSVLVAKFSSGLKVVYKPRSLAVDVHFQQLLSWLNQRGNHPPFRILKILNWESYGWVEFVTAQNCTELQAIERFYERQGAYLALLYAIEATDFHLENLIASGEDPVLVDLESLFHPRTEGMDIIQSDLPTVKTIVDSVLRVNLLPQRLWANAESEGIDMSGLGGKAGQMTPNPVLQLEAKGTDEMRFKRKRMLMSGGKNRPTLNDAEVNVLDYTEMIITGFSNMYLLLLQYRDELLSEHSPLTCFAEDEVRFIIRPTQTYSSLLSESFHPDFLRNALERDRFLNRLWLDIEQQPYLAKVIAAEREDLWQNDIPIFTTRPNSRDIWTSSYQQITNFFNETGLSLVQRRIQQLSESDLKQQSWFIRASLSTLAMADEQAKWPTYQPSEPPYIATQEQFLAAAQAVGDHLESLALHGEKDVSWLGLTLIKDKHWTLSPLEINLYDGIAGVILFLAYLGSVTHQSRYTVLAKTALQTMENEVENNKQYITSIGGFSGWGGIIYTLTHLGVLWNQPELLAKAEAIVEFLPNLISQDEQLDIIDGAAGCIASLLNLYRFVDSQNILAAAMQCGDRLITFAQPMKQGIGWIPKGIGKKPLTGFSHGAAGIACALLELSAITGEERFRKIALEAIAYERSLFSQKAGNWPDLRNFENAVLSGNTELDNFMTAWCHGATGIGLGRLRCLPYLDDLKIRAEIDTALKTTLSQGFGMNHCLCHGDIGNLELLLQASIILDSPQLHLQVNRFSTIILDSINNYGWLCGVPLGAETPGLMTGLAGIGYGLLRIATSMHIPSMLVLEPPILNKENI
ncbi:MAG: type 2 lantipeptide synthetase LanM [Dolichospermum sp. DET73]|nr:type 2 lantipeptide synthetase LanM [Dolichospermum sp. DET73]